MRYKIEQWFAVLLALMMTFTALPATALAESVTPTEGTKVEQVQTMIDALPEAEEITAENRVDVQAQIDAIDAAMLDLTEEEAAALNTARYDAAVAALSALDDQAADPDPDPEPSADPDSDPESSADPNPDPEPSADPNPDPEPSADPDSDPEPSAGPSALEQVQALIDALPDADTITADNRTDVEAQLTAIDEAKLALEDEELDALDVTRYTAAVEALLALDDMAGADEPKTIAFLDGLNGTGNSAENPYRIENAEQLRQLSEYVNAETDCEGLFFLLTADIDLGGGPDDQWTPIGNEDVQFKGSFDGGSHTVSGLYIKSEGKDLGLFGVIGGGGTVKNLGVSGSVTGENTEENYVGGIAGNNGGTIENCYNAADITGYPYVGGIAGRSGSSNGAYIQNCYNTGTIHGYSSSRGVGGIVGQLGSGLVKNCYNAGDIISDHYPVGGVVGSVNGEYYFSNCYSVGNVTGNDYAFDQEYVGGIVGEDYSYPPSSCFYLKDSAPRDAGPYGGPGRDTEKTADEFRSLASDLNNGGGDVWEDDPFLGRPVLKTNREPWPISGSGTESDPYLIPDKETLEKVRDYINNSADGGTEKYFALTAEIELGGDADHPWTPIGDVRHPFQGSFDGGEFTVRGLYINVSDQYGGLFGYIGENGAVKNLTVEGEVSGDMDTGGIAGRCEGSIENCENAATITGPMCVGGIVGEVSGSASIQDCRNDGKVTGTATYVGGIVGKISGDVTIGGCKNTGEVSGNTANVGGIAGGANDGATIENCRNTGEVSDGGGSGTNIGGVVGWNGNQCTVADCSSSGNVFGIQYTGGVVGTNSGTVKNSYNTGKIAGMVLIGGVVGSNAGGLENCYNVGSVTGESEKIGGVAGSNYGTVKNCYNTGKVRGLQNTGGVVGYQIGGSCENSCYLDTCGATGDAGTAKTAGEFRFLASSLGDGWADSVEGRPVLLDNQETDIIDADTPYEIPDLDTMKAFRDYINGSADGGKGKTFKLTEDIDLKGGKGNEWTPIGDTAGQFKGTFDGDGHTISGLYINQSNEARQGLFSTVGEGGTVKNLTAGGTVIAGGYSAGIVGWNNGGAVENCLSICKIGADSSSYCGGVVGWNGGGTVKNCYNTGNISGKGYLGGVVGRNEGTVISCYNTGNISCTTSLFGGVVGYNEESGTVTNCYYLSGTAASGIGGGDGDATAKTADQFASGEVTYLLQSGQDTSEPQIWGQTVGNGIPELTHDEEKKVYKVAFQSDGTECAVKYANPAGLTELPADPEKAGFAFAGWSQTSGGTVDFTAETPISGDMIVYAIFTDKRLEGTGTVTMKDYTCGDDSVNPVAESATNGTGSVTITYSVRGQEEYSEEKPTAAGEYTVKAVFAATEDYHEVTATADFKITHQFNAEWEHREDGDHHRCACDTELLLETKQLTEVPEGLKGTPAVDTVEEIKQILAEKVDTGDHYAIYDVELEAWIGGKWQIIMPEGLPDEGVAITIPYPEGTNAKYPFTVVHMFTTAGDGHAPGDTEVLKATNEADGVHFTVKSFSPIILGWKTGNLTVSVTDTGKSADPAQQWQFCVELGDTEINGQYGDMNFTDGVATFTLGSGQSLTARDLPEGMAYTVTELNENQNGYTTTYTDDSGFITSEQDMVAAFVNDKPAPAQPDKPSDDPDNPPDDPDNPPDTPDNPPNNPDNPSDTPDNPPGTPNNPSDNPDNPSGTPDNPPDTPPEKTSDSDTPDTGDHSHLELWLVMMILLFMGIMVTMTSILKERRATRYQDRHLRK